MSPELAAAREHSLPRVRQPLVVWLAFLDERAKTVVVIVAGGTALEVGAHPGDLVVGCRAPELEVDVLVEFLEALFAKQLAVGRAEQPLENVVSCALVQVVSA